MTMDHNHQEKSCCLRIFNSLVKNQRVEATFKTTLYSIPCQRLGSLYNTQSHVDWRCNEFPFVTGLCRDNFESHHHMSAFASSKPKEWKTSHQYHIHHHHHHRITIFENEFFCSISPQHHYTLHQSSSRHH